MFYGRDDLLERLDALWNKSVASLVTCRGRRRIGKSTLIAEFARRSRVRFVKLEGLQPDEHVDNAAQLAAFCRQLEEQTGVDCGSVKNWFEAFARLDEAIGRRAKVVVLLDEISWMGKYDPLFPAELKYAWDNRFARHPRLIMVLCGSVSAVVEFDRAGASAGRVRQVLGQKPRTSFRPRHYRRAVGDGRCAQVS